LKKVEKKIIFFFEKFKKAQADATRDKG